MNACMQTVYALFIIKKYTKRCMTMDCGEEIQFVTVTNMKS